MHMNYSKKIDVNCLWKCGKIKILKFIGIFLSIRKIIINLSLLIYNYFFFFRYLVCSIKKIYIIKYNYTILKTM